MKPLKGIFGILMAGTLLFALAACGQQEDPAPEGEQSSSLSQEEDPQESSGQLQEGNSAAGGKTLVVYYSASGNTEEVAGYLAAATGGDLFEILPAQPYTSADLDWTDETSWVNREHEDTALRAVELTTTTVENWETYDTVFLGYPIWWGIAAWPVDSFVEANDFTGKTVIPFCTSTSSGLGQSGTLLADLAGTGDWQEGQRFPSGASEDDVTEWVNTLGLAQ